MKIAQLRSFFWSAFYSIKTEYSVPLRIQSESGKIRTRKNSVFEHFSRSFFFQLIMMKVIMKRGWNKVLQIFNKVLGIIC